MTSYAAQIKINDKGIRLLEIFRNGKHWPESFDRPPGDDFKFGVRAAYFISVEFEMVREFCNNGGKPPKGNVDWVSKPGKGNISEVNWKWHEEFETSNGKRVLQSYLNFVGEKTRLGFGVEKATALIICENDIKKFAAEFRS